MSPGEILSNSLLFVLSITATLLVGGIFIRKVGLLSISSKAFLAYSIGVCVISLTGMIANYIGASIFPSQLLVSILLALFFLATSRFPSTLKDLINIKENYMPLVFGVFASIVFIYNFSNIIIWTAGDGAFHASIINDIVVGNKVPQSVFALDRYYDVYPKVFHFYAAYFARATGLNVIRVMKVLPIAIVIITSMGIYSLCRELGINRSAAGFAFMISFAIWKHHYPLFWMGYPQLLAFLLIIAFIVALNSELSNNRFPVSSIILFTGLFFTHQKHFLYLIPVATWIFFRAKLKINIEKSFMIWIYSILAIIILFWFLGGVVPFNFPVYLKWLIESQGLLKEQLYLWNVGALGFLGLIFLLYRYEKSYEIPVVLFFSGLIIGILIDSSVLRIFGTGDNRMYAVLYIPSAILSAFVLDKTISNLISKVSFKKWTRGLFTLNLFLIFFLLLSSAFINTERLSWNMAEEDYNAIVYLTQKSGIALNIDPTGEWITPVSGMQVIAPRGRLPVLEETLVESIIRNPVSKQSLNILTNLQGEYGDVYIFISSITIERPGYWIFMERYPKVDLTKFNNRYYELVFHEEGAIVLRFNWEAP